MPFLPFQASPNVFCPGKQSAEAPYYAASENDKAHLFGSVSGVKGKKVLHIDRNDYYGG